MKNFMTIWIGELISSIGSGYDWVYCFNYVYQLSGATLVSIAALLAFLPTIY